MNYSLVTGASGGIGLEIAKLLAKDKNNLILVARDQEKLLKIKERLEQDFKIKVYVIIKDLAYESAAEEIYEEIDTKGLIVDKLINNAGFGSFGAFIDIEASRDLSMIDVNVRALTNLTKLFLPDMVKRKHGYILNVASTAAFMPGPYMAVYYASKAYVLSLSEALASELKGSGVSVSVLCPGPTKTDFQSKANMKKSDFVKFSVMDATTVALLGYRGMLKGKRIIIPGAINKLMLSAMKLLPRKTVVALAKSTQKVK